MSRPLFLLVSGLMGSGKSTLISGGFIGDLVVEYFPKHSQYIRILNVDERARITRKHENCEASRAWIDAAIDVETIIDWHLRSRKSIGVESVLGSNKYRHRVQAANANSFIAVNLHVTAPDEYIVKRVEDRKRRGGHGADWSDFVDLKERVYENFEWFFKSCDLSIIVDNSREIASPVFIGNTRKREVEPLVNYELFHRIRKHFR